jgi:hypothetical protein
MHGIIEGIQYGQMDRTEDINARMQERISPNQTLRPNFDPRSVATKYSKFPIVVSRTPCTVPIISCPDYSVNSSFCPMTHRGPPAEFLTNIDHESSLHNMHVALQRGGEQGIYVPSSNSDMYVLGAIPTGGRIETQPFPEMFSHPTFAPNRRAQNTNNTRVGADMFNNNTRTQMRGTF